MIKSLPFVVIVSISLLIHADIANQDRFDRFWYDGNAEISTYELQESRYGELRTGIRTMVFVTEPMRLTTHIKPDVTLPSEEKIKVIKLNDLRKFATGIYDYSVMTSVFTAVEAKSVYPDMGTMKLSFSSQEWCGQVFDRIVRNPATFTGVLYSYFESDGETSYTFDAQGIDTEDNLWIRIRELDGPFLSEGETRTLRLIPSSWILRKMHIPPSIVQAVIVKGKPRRQDSFRGKIDVVTFSWTINAVSTEVVVETKYPHLIIGWRERDGSSGTLVATSREPYWEQNAEKHRHLRGKLKQPVF